MLEKICLIVKKSSGPEPNEPPRSGTQTISRITYKQSKNRPGVTSTEAVEAIGNVTSTSNQYRTRPPTTIGAVCLFMIPDLPRKGKD